MMPTFVSQSREFWSKTSRDKSSEVFSDAETLKMGPADLPPVACKRSKSEKFSFVIGIAMFFFCAAVMIAAAMCYVRHAGDEPSISNHTESNPSDGIIKRQYSYGGEHPTWSIPSAPDFPNTTTSSSVTSLTDFITSAASQTRVSTYSAENTATIYSTITVPQNVTSPSASPIVTTNEAGHTTTILMTVTVSQDFSSSATSPPVVTTNDTRHTTTIFKTVTISQDFSSSATSPLVVTTIVTKSVVPIPATNSSSGMTTGTAAGVTGAPQWTSISTVSGWNSTTSSFVGGLTGGTVYSTTIATVPDNCTSDLSSALGMTTSTNDAVTASSQLSSDSALSTRTITTTLSSSTYASSDASMSSSSSISGKSESLYNTTTTVTYTPTTTVEIIVTSPYVTAQGTTFRQTRTLNGTTTVYTSQVSNVTQTIPGLCTPIVSTFTQIVVQTITMFGSLSSTLASNGGLSAQGVGSPQTQSTTTEIASVIINPSTTITLDPQRPENLNLTTTTITQATPMSNISISIPCTDTASVQSTTSNDAVANPAPSSMSSSSSGGLMSNGMAELSTATSQTSASYISLNPSTVTFGGTGAGIPIATVTSTVHVNGTQATLTPSTPVVNGGSGKPAPKYWGGGNTGSGASSCTVMLVALVSLLLI